MNSMKKQKKNSQAGKTRMPKWPRAQVLHQDSLTFLLNAFRGWRPVSEQVNDIGIDVRFEIIRPDGSATGAEFSAQVKAASELIFIKGQASVRLKISTANYFLSRPELVLLVLFDSRRGAGYFLWVQEFLHANWKHEWLEQGTVTIKVPQENRLEREARKSIEERVRRHHVEHKLLTAYRTTKNPVFDYRISMSNSSAIVEVLPRHIVGSGETVDVSFEVSTPEGREEAAKFERHLRTGEMVEIDPRFVTRFPGIELIADFLRQDAEQVSASLILESRPMDRRLPFKYIFDSADRSLHFEIPYVELKLKAVGTDQATWSNEHQGIVHLVEIHENKRGVAMVTFGTTHDPRTVRDALGVIKLNRILATGGDSGAIDLRTGFEYKGVIPSKGYIPPAEWVLNLAEDLFLIEQKAGIAFVWPRVIKREDMDAVRAITGIIRTGAFPCRAIVKRTEAKLKLIDDLNRLEEGVELPITFGVTMDFLVLGETVHMGPADFVGIGELTAESREKLGGFEELQDDDVIELEFNCTRETQFRFSMWPERNNDRALIPIDK
jgi:hypothetical protein